MFGANAVLHFPKTASTQDVARRLADEGAPAWTLVRADRQTRGRGRMDRRWTSGSGGLYFSLIARPKFVPARLARLSLACGRELAAILARLGRVKTRVKPPNDVLARSLDSGGSYKKICGILIEAAGTEQCLDWIVIGVGINLSNKISPSLPYAASISSLSGQNPDPDRVLASAVRALRRAIRSAY